MMSRLRRCSNHPMTSRLRRCSRRGQSGCTSEAETDASALQICGRALRGPQQVSSMPTGWPRARCQSRQRRTRCQSRGRSPTDRAQRCSGACGTVRRGRCREHDSKFAAGSGRLSGRGGPCQWMPLVPHRVPAHRRRPNCDHLDRTAGHRRASAWCQAWCRNQEHPHRGRPWKGARSGLTASDACERRVR